MRRRMTALMVLAVLMLACPLAAKAAAETSMLLPLASADLLAMLRQSTDQDWDFYQPAARETDTDTSSGPFLEEQSTYPIVACREDEVCLLVLKKVEGQWTLDVANERALVRKGFCLKGFSVDEGSSAVNGEQHVYFDFKDEHADELTLNLQLSDLYPSYFSFLQSGDVEVIFHYDRGMTFQYDYPFLTQCAYKVDPDPPVSFAVDEFSLAECPTGLQALLVPASVSPREEAAGLYALPDEGMTPVFQLGAGEALEVVHQRQAADWALVRYRGNLFFIHGDEVAEGGEP